MHDSAANERLSFLKLCSPHLENGSASPCCLRSCWPRPLSAPVLHSTLTQQQEFQFLALLFFLFQQNPVDLLVDSGGSLLLLCQAPGTAAPSQGPGHGGRFTDHQVTSQGLQSPNCGTLSSPDGVEVGVEVTPGPSVSLPRACGSPGKGFKRPGCWKQGGDLGAASRPLQLAQTWPCPPDRSVVEAPADEEGGVAAFWEHSPRGV